MLVLTTHHRDTGAVLSHWVMSRIQVLYLVAQSCLTLCYPLDCSPPGSSVHGDSPGKNTGVSYHALHQGIFPTQRSNPGLPHCRWITSWTKEAQEYWSGYPRADLPDPGIESRSSALQASSLPTELPWKPDANTKSSREPPEPFQSFWHPVSQGLWRQTWSPHLPPQGIQREVIPRDTLRTGRHETVKTVLASKVPS